MKRIILLTFIAIIVIFSTSCEKTNKKLIVGNWQAIEFITEDSTFYPQPLDDENFTIKFEKDNNLIGNTTVNNQLGGHYSLNEHTIAIHAQRLTDIGEFNNYVDQLFIALNESSSYNLYNDTLILKYNFTDKLILVRRK